MGEREHVLARRRLALMALGALVPVTLVIAIITGSLMFLVINLIADVLIAGYVAMLLQIKQGQGGPVSRDRGNPAAEDVRVVRN
jgi:hypothetical protein